MTVWKQITHRLDLVFFVTLQCWLRPILASPSQSNQLLFFFETQIAESFRTFQVFLSFWGSLEPKDVWCSSGSFTLPLAVLFNWGLERQKVRFSWTFSFTVHRIKAVGQSACWYVFYHSVSSWFSLFFEKISAWIEISEQNGKIMKWLQLLSVLPLSTRKSGFCCFNCYTNTQTSSHFYLCRDFYTYNRLHSSLP